ncbi:MAG: hypothetical protein EOP04_01060 [Proteobacteria bacterium]|nr:MAG: hypothetical protein EOP04_01060 [Pseudomonadota bacterium]
MSSPSKKSLRYHWIAGGIASSLSRFIPLPLVDGYIDERAKRYCLDKTLIYHGRKFEAKAINPIYKDSTTIPGWVASKFKQLALYPVRKVAKMMTASTGVPKDFARTYLLARAIDFCLASNFLADSSSPSALTNEARKIREAFDSAFEKLDDILIKTTTRIIRREFSEMGPEVSAALAKIVGRPIHSSGSSEKEKNGRKTSKNSRSTLEDDAAFSKLASKFDEVFRKEMADRNLQGV